jgi:hypothetical protein
MKRISIIFLMSIITSCHSQDKDKPSKKKTTTTSERINLELPINPKTMQTHTTEEFTEQDIQKYKKNKIDGGYEYTRGDGAKVLETDDELILFTRDITPENSLFTLSKEYHPNRRLWMKYNHFINGGFIKGVFYEYDESGKLTKAEDYDKPFKFTWEHVKKYIEQDLKLDFFKDEVNINNYNGLSGGKPTWDINFKGNYKDVFGVYYVTLDGTDGELLKVKKILGRDGEQQIIFEKK